MYQAWIEDAEDKGIRSGEVKAPGMVMSANDSGMMAFVGGLMGHMVFGLIVALLVVLLKFFSPPF